MTKLTDKEKIQKIYQDWKYYKKIENPTIPMKVAAIRSFPRLFLRMDLSSEELQLALLKEFEEDICLPFHLLGDDLGQSKDPYAKEDCFVTLYSNFEDPSEKVQHIILDRTPNGGFHRYYNKYDSIKKRLLKSSWYNIKYIENPSDELIAMAAQQSLKALEYVKELSDEAKYMILESRKNFSEFSYSYEDRYGDEYHSFTDEFHRLGKLNEKCQVFAVKKFSYYILEKIPDQYEKAQIEALNQSYKAFKYIKNPTKNMINLFLKKCIEEVRALKRREDNGQPYLDIKKYLQNLNRSLRVELIQMDYTLISFYTMDSDLEYIASRIFDLENIKKHEDKVKNYTGDVMDILYYRLEITRPFWYKMI